MKKFIALVRKIADRTVNIRPHTEQAQDAYMANRVKSLMKKAFNAGREYTEISKYPEDGFEFDYKDFNDWFKKKYE